MIAALIRWSARNVALVLIGAVLATAAGIHAVRNVPLDAIPDLSDTQVIVYTEAPGQAPQGMSHDGSDGGAGASQGHQRGTTADLFQDQPGKNQAISGHAFAVHYMGGIEQTPIRFGGQLLR